jgi:D-alanyl-D-alanine carboxypeptidase
MKTAGTERRRNHVALGLAVVLVAACGSAAPSSVGSPGASAPRSAAASPTTFRPSPRTAAQPSSPATAAIVPLGPLPTGALDPARTGALQEALESAVRSGALDVIAAVITERGSWAGAAGIGGPKDRKATPEDEFAIASLTKTLTAALIMRLSEQGRIDLDRPLADYMGDFDVETNGATVRQAVAMQGGFADHGPDAASRIRANPARVWTWPDRIAGYPAPVSKPGTYAYSSPSYELLALAAEQVTGVTYGRALRNVVLDPVGADRIVEQEAGGLTPQPWAVPIDEHLGVFKPTDIGAGGAISCISSASFGPGAGSVASDAPSLARWLWHLFAGDILKPATLAPMIDAGLKGWAYGFESAPYSEAGALSSSGNKTGYGAQWNYFPASRAIVVIFVNDPDFIVEPTVSTLLAAANAP